MNNLRVAIFGCGPSGLAAAQGVLNAGVPKHNINIYSIPKKSQIFGAQYLHLPLAGVDCGEPSQIAVKFVGTAKGYRQKVYGEKYQGVVSPQEFDQDHRAWDLRAVYEKLWESFESCIEAYEMSPMSLEEHYQDLLRTFDIVINTVPRRAICKNPEHQFKSQAVYAIGDAPDLGVCCPISCEPNTLVYNGSPDYAWYRISNIFDYSTAEWSASEDRPKPPISGLALVNKPLSTDCSCWDGFHHLGRFGAWQKGVLVHHVSEQAAYLASASNQGIQSQLF